MASTTCPDLQDLVHLVLGKVAPEVASNLKRHLLECGGCVDTLHNLKAEDTLIHQLQAQADRAEPGAKQEIDSLIRRLKGKSDSSAADGPTVRHVGDIGATPADEPITFLEPPQGPGELGWLGPYRVLRTLGAGGMGIVFLAEDTHLQRPVALKVMRTQLTADLGARQRFLREARAAAGLKHDHVVTVYQVGQENDVPFLAMEFLEGESLEDRLDREPKLALPEALRIAREVAEGLAAAHERGLIHRDIKPANIWLEKRGGEAADSGGSRVKILDFGLARGADQSNLTSHGVIIGTPRYMSPEQARGSAVDHRCDLFSLGSILYLMCTGRPAFSGSDALSVLASLAIDEPPPVTDFDPNLPPALADLLKQLLAKDPAGRPESARAVAEILRTLGTAVPGGGRRKEDRAQIEKDSVAKTLNLADVPPPSPGRPTEVLPSAPRPSWLHPRSYVLVASFIVLLAAGFVAWKAHSEMMGGTADTGPTGPPIKVGILHSLSGTLGESTNAVVDATQLAIEELNEQGGVLGRPVEAVVKDGESDWSLFAGLAEQLITQDKVCTIFGCWTSAGRKSVKPVVERHDHLLIYPVQYEGLEESPNIVYNGAAPNQQILPAVRYCLGFLNARRFFLVGSDYVFPRTANAIVRDELKAKGAQVVGEEYIPLGEDDMADVVRKIAAAKPDVILNTINGDGNRAFFRGLRRAGVTPDKTPTVSFSLAEHELRTLPVKDMIGDYAAWNYFQSVNRPANEEFIRRFREKYGPQRVTSDPMEAAYFGVHLWAKAVTAAGSDDVQAIRRALKEQSFDAPEGPVRIDPANQHTWKVVRLGRIVEGGQFEVVWETAKPIRPEPFPPSRTRAEWEQFLADLSAGWGGGWARPEGR